MTPTRIAILDLYEGHANEGMRCITEILQQIKETHQNPIDWKIFDVRQKLELPDTGFDLYISSGGPGSPTESEGSTWDNLYFEWLQSIMEWNQNALNFRKKYVFFICHSYQLACRFFKIGHVTKRKSTAFGVFPIHMMEHGSAEPVFEGLHDPFYGVDSRDYQVIQPNHEVIETMGAQMLCLEKERPHVELERAIMAIRFNPYMIGTQFHPEADPEGMSRYLLRDEKKEIVIQQHGAEKWSSMIEQLNDPEKIKMTYSHILPNFIQQSIASLQQPYSLS
jgi:GMP synthase-like glutamine amidotransferase